MKAVLFDIDNTLLIKRPTIAEKWHKELNRAGYCVSKDDAERAFAECEMWVGHQTHIENVTGVRLSDAEFMNGFMECCLSAFGISADAADILADVWIGKYDKHYETSYGAVKCLEALRRRGIKTGIVSNNYSSIRKELMENGLEKFFSVIAISDEVKLYKPDPKILLYACDKLGVLPEDTLYVGDHPYDVVCANEAHVNAAWMPANSHMRLPADTEAPLFRISSLCELEKLLGAEIN